MIDRRSARILLTVSLCTAFLTVPALASDAEGSVTVTVVDPVAAGNVRVLPSGPRTRLTPTSTTTAPVSSSW